MSEGRARRFAVLVESLETAKDELHALARRDDVALVDQVRLSQLEGRITEIGNEARQVKRRYDERQTHNAQD